MKTVIILIIPILMGLIIVAVVIFTLGAVLVSALAAGLATLASSLVTARKARRAEPVELPSFGYLRLKTA